MNAQLLVILDRIDRITEDLTHRHSDDPYQLGTLRSITDHTAAARALINDDPNPGGYAGTILDLVARTALRDNPKPVNQ
jgi:hypothetical protein